MNTPKKKQDSYQTELRARVEKWWNEEAEAADLDKLYAFVKNVTLESFKNGVKVGQRRARPTSQQEQH